MAELLSVGLDVGTTSTQMVVSRLGVENRASQFAVPELTISRREVLYKSPVHFTPLLDEAHMDGPALRELVLAEYARAGITREQVDTGAIIITGESSRRENARAVLDALSDLAGDFVVAAAGPDLESVLAAKGSGAVEHSRETGRTLLHMDIGGGTSNLALIRQGEIVATGCLNVGGRLVKYDADGIIRYVSPVLAGITHLHPGQRAQEAELVALCRTLTQVLEAAAGRGNSPHLQRLTTAGTAPLPLSRENVTLSFSGGVADCIAESIPWTQFGDIGPLLGRAIRESELCRPDYVLGRDAIRATVIGAGCHSAMLSGSTVYCQNVALPLKNLPALPLPDQLSETLSRQDGPVVLCMPGLQSPSYADIDRIADSLAAGLGGHPAYLCIEADMAKALGQALALRLGRDAPILCIDRVRLGAGSYLDVGKPVGPAFPVVVKALIFSRE